MKKYQLRKLIRETIREQADIENIPNRVVDPPPPPPGPGPAFNPNQIDIPDDRGVSPEGACDPNCSYLMQLKNNFDWDGAVDSLEGITPANPPSLVDALKFGQKLHTHIEKIWRTCCLNKVPNSGGTSPVSTGGNTINFNDPGSATPNKGLAGTGGSYTID